MNAFTPTSPASRAHRLEELAQTMLAMLEDLDNGWPWKELCATMADVRIEAEALGLELNEDAEDS